MKIGIYLGDIKKPESIGDYTFVISFVKELLKTKAPHEFIFYYFGQKNAFNNLQNIKNAKFICLKYYKKPEISLNPLKIKTYKTPLVSLNHKLKKDNVNIAFFIVPYLHEHIEIPYFATIRDVAHRILPHFPEFSTNSVFEKMEKKLNAFLTGASKIITCNSIAKNDIRTLYDVIEENITTMPIPYPSWLKETNCDDEKILKENNIEKNSYIFYPAQFWTHKNHIRLILAAQVMKEQNINLKVVFTGFDRGNLKYLKKATSKLGLEDDVLFLNSVSKEELCVLYKNALALVYPCLAGPDSIVALEAMYYGCPVLISNHLGYMEQLKKAAFYFNPLDEMDIVEKIKLLNDIEKKDEILVNSKNLIEKSDFAGYIERFLDIADSFYSVRMCWSMKEMYEDKI